MPSFAIEVPGETTPFNEESLIHTLQAASSSNPVQIQHATKQLQQWEKSSGFYRNLQSCFLNRNLPFESRYLAIIQLKNGIDKYWRKTALNAVPKEDKDIIRGRQLSGCLDENDDRLALQAALVTAKIARFEYPQDWPDLISSLCSRLRESDRLHPLHVARCLLTLLRVVKELATARLQRSRQKLQAAAPSIVFVLATLWSNTTALWTEKLSASPSIDHDLRYLMYTSLLAIKTLRRVIVMASEHPNRDHDIVAFWALTEVRLGSLMQLTIPVEVKELVNKNILQLAKLHQSMAGDLPAAFALFPGSMNLVIAYWGLVERFGNKFGSTEVVVSPDASDVTDDKYTEKLVLLGLKIIRACVKMVHHPAHSFKLKSPEDKQQRDQARQVIAQQLLTQVFIQQVTEILVKKYFVFRECDLHDWVEEPEEWEQREEGTGDDYEFSVRSCSEKLFLDLAINYKDMLVEPLLQAFYEVANLENSNILLKDSLYTAVGLAAPVLHEHLDFDGFVRDVLAPEVRITKPGYHIIRRRATILLGQWVSVKFSQRRLAYEIFQHVLDPADALNDKVVRVTAGRQLNKIIDSFEFEATEFLPYSETTIVRLMNLIQEVESTETKIPLLNTISLIIQQLDQHIVPFAEGIVSLLSPLWSSAADQPLMQQSILASLTRLVDAMRASSSPLHELSIPIIKAAIQPGSDIAVYLLDDAMDLWSSILSQSVNPNHEILALTSALYPIYELGSENLRQALEITESYVLLAPEYMLSEGVQWHVLSALSALIGHIGPDANGFVCNLIELIFQVAGQLEGEIAVNRAMSNLVKTGIMAKLLQGLRGSYIAHCTTGPRALESFVDGIVETDYFSILSRLVLSSLTGFCRAVETCMPHIEQDPASLVTTMKWLLEEWFSHFENVSDIARRKLMCLALTRLLETNQDFILINLQSLMTVWTDVVTELREDAKDSGDDSLHYSNDIQFPTDDSESPEDVRRRLLLYADVVHTVKASEFIKQHLDMAIAADRPRFEQEWLANVDKDVIASFGALGIM